MIKKSKIPTIVGVIVLLISTFAGVFLLGMKQVFRIGADASTSPKDIRVTNISDVSATITWTTSKKTVGFVNWGESASSLNKIEKQSRPDEKTGVHSVSLSGLKENTTYFYKINSDGNGFDNNGIPWEFTTGPSLGINKENIVISGSVITASGSPEKGSLIQVNIGGYLLSSVSSDNGTFVFKLGGVRTQDLQSYAKIDEKQTLLQVSVVSESGEVASVQIFPQSAKPIPPIILGQVQDYRNLEPSLGGQIPSANLNLPNNVLKQSKINVSAPTGSPTPTSVILESLKEGEIITSTKPAFFGRGPAGESITITVKSDPIIQTLQIAKNGTWTWSPPVDLAAGPHSVTISWVDSGGITRTVTRNFIVQAGEVPAFVATPSQTLSPSASPTATAMATSTPKVTATPKITSTPKPTATASAAPLPDTGSINTTILMSIMSIAVILFGLAIWKNAETI